MSGPIPTDTQILMEMLGLMTFMYDNIQRVVVVDEHVNYAIQGRVVAIKSMIETRHMALLEKAKAAAPQVGGEPPKQETHHEPQ